MAILVDDVGSFPLPNGMSRESFDEAYLKARQAIDAAEGARRTAVVPSLFSSAVIDSFRLKLSSGLDMVTYPQLYDMHRQILDLVYRAADKGTYLVDYNEAILPEVNIIKDEARKLSEEHGRPIRLRTCVAGPLELYLKVVGTTYYEDVMMMFAETVRRFLENSIVNSKYIKTEVVSIDEPSFGFHEVQMEKDAVTDTLRKACDLTGVTRQIHLHSAAHVSDLMDVPNIDVLSFEFAGSPNNIDLVSKSMLEKGDKRLRVGIARTDVDTMLAELHDRGGNESNIEQLVEPEDIILKRFKIAKAKYGDQMTFTGPDCGLGGWPSQELALLLLRRTVRAVRKETMV
jgi:5-methyltetrahydropteroyltriglutamate--homocysteine methyltransferase